jgi:hypothetical protein
VKARFFGAVVVAVSLLFADPLRQPLQAQRGQPVYPAYDGYVKNPDGSFTLSFAYFNHNAEPVTVSPGANNARGQNEDCRHCRRGARAAEVEQM